MHVIYPHHRQRQQIRRPNMTRRIVIAVCIGVGIFATVNLLLLGIYRDRTYPKTSLAGISVGNKTVAQVMQVASQQNIVPEKLTITRGQQQASIAPSDLGVRSDTTRTKASMTTSRSWLPIVNLFKKHVVAAPVAIDNNQLNTAADRLAPSFHVAPINAKVALDNGTFKALAGHDGHDLDQQKLSAFVLYSIDQGQKVVAAPVITKQPVITLAAAEKQAKQLQDSLQVDLHFRYKDKDQKPTSKDIASWYVAADDTYVLDAFAIRTFIAKSGKQMEVQAANLTEAVNATKNALQKRTASSVSLTPYAATKTYNYCAAVKGVSNTYLTGLKTELDRVYSDLRGWSVDGQVQYKYSETACDFTVWIAAPSEMTSFGAICDEYWSCEVGTNVILNANRWDDSSEPWKKAGRNLADYHVMVINHETGHMLGFGHPSCPGTGQPAPVMMQQSIALQGCVFNIWPTQNELDTLKRNIGL